MRSDLSQTLEDFERVAEDYFHLIPPDVHDFKIDLCVHWEYDDISNILIFDFDDVWNMEEFYDKILACPRYKMHYALDETYPGMDYVNNRIIVEAKKGGLI